MKLKQIGLILLLSSIILSSSLAVDSSKAFAETLIDNYNPPKNHPVRFGCTAKGGTFSECYPPGSDPTIVWLNSLISPTITITVILSTIIILFLLRKELFPPLEIDDELVDKQLVDTQELERLKNKLKESRQLNELMYKALLRSTESRN